ncbi:MAG: ECF-type sigma factor [Candidatus Limnocylindrales bacterium]
MDSITGSVTQHIVALKAGDEAAVQPLWDRYFEHLARLVRAHLRATRTRSIVADEEDMALSAIQSVCDGIQNGRFPQLDDRDDLWKLLVCVARCKVLDQRKHEAREKRGGGKVVTEADLAADDDAARPLDQLDPTAVIYQTARGEPTPEFAALVAEEYARRMDQLGDPELCRIAELKLACFTNQEIAQAIGRSLRTTTLRLEKIRKLWAPAG